MAGDASAKTFSFETVAVLIALMDKAGVKLGPVNYQLMASLDGQRTASSFDHGFREVKRRAKEIAVQAGGASNGGTPAPTPRKKADGKASGTKRKGSKKNASEDDDNDDEESSPTKKTKVKDEATEEVNKDRDDFWDQ
ncbi:hypothetical protein LTR17_006022 [Elasticomyces elasticus]|nr:hypothetical protein LTR17_006022 [Elasticomyces elasticus]